MLNVILFFFFAAFVLEELIVGLLSRYIFSKWVRYTHSDYDRELSKIEIDYILEAQNTLGSYAENTRFPKLYGFCCILPFFLIPSLFGVFYIIWSRASIWFNQKGYEDVVSGEWVFYQGSNVGIAAIIGIFAAILVAGWGMYFLFRKNSRLINYLVLNEAIDNSESVDSILGRRKVQIVHDVRISRLDIAHTFSVSEFLQSIYKRHHTYTRWISLALLTPTLFFFPLDLRWSTWFGSESISEVKYWTAQNKKIPYAALSNVSVECNGAKINLIFEQEGKKVARIDVMDDRDSNKLIHLNALDDVLQQSDIVFKAHYLFPPGKPPNRVYTSACFEKLEQDYSVEDYMTLRKILHADALLKK